MNILLIYPQMAPTFWNMDYLMKIVGKKAGYPPLGLLTVAALLPEGWNKRLVDLNVTRLDYSHLSWADYAFISATNVQCVSAREIIQSCREAGVKTVAGGPLFTHEHSFFPGVDHFVLNEAELSLPPFLDDLSAGKLKRLYSTKKFADVRQTPVPAWDLVDPRYYAYAVVQYSRGCPYQCDFCDVTALLGRKPRLKTSAQVVAELELILRTGSFDMILFADDNLIGNRRQLKSDLLPALIDWRGRHRYAPGFSTQVSINLADDPELMQLMLEAGFRHIFVGIETPDTGGLAASQKSQNLDRDLLADVRRLQQAGFIVTGGFILGFDTDSPDTAKRMVNFIQKSGIVIATINILKAPTGTILYQRMKRENRLIEPFDFNENRTNIIPLKNASFNPNVYESALREVYSNRSVYQRIHHFLDQYGGARVNNPITRRLHWSDIGLFFRIVFHLVFKSPERWYVFRLTIRTLLHKPGRLDLIFLFSSLMVHFRRLLERYLETTPSTQPGSSRGLSPP